MVGRLILIYAVVELMALIGLTAAIGFAWAVLVLLASFVLGLVLWAPMGGWQLSRQLGQLRSGLQEPRSVLSDGALVAVATGSCWFPAWSPPCSGCCCWPRRSAGSPSRPDRYRGARFAATGAADRRRGGEHG